MRNVCIDHYNHLVYINLSVRLYIIVVVVILYTKYTILAGFYDDLFLLQALSSLFPVSSLQVSITPGANPTAGQSYTFTCTVTQGELTGTPTVQWMGPGSSDPITTGGDFTVSSTPPYTLTINPLRQSHNGQYTCQATTGDSTGSSSATLTVQGY